MKTAAPPANRERDIDSTAMGSCTLVRRHLIYCWASLFLFILVGLALEALHAFKSPYYLDAEHETRRMMWRLAHGHGAFLALIHGGLAWTFSQLNEKDVEAGGAIASFSMLGASLLIPAGFFLGGLYAIDGDPGLAIALVPAGAFLLLVSVGLACKLCMKKT